MSLCDLENVLQVNFDRLLSVYQCPSCSAHRTRTQTLYFSRVEIPLFPPFPTRSSSLPLPTRSPIDVLFPRPPLPSFSHPALFSPPSHPAGQPSSHTISLHCLCSAFHITLSTLCSLFPVIRFLCSIVFVYIFSLQFMHIPSQVLC